LLTLYHSCLHRLADRHTNLRPDPERNRFHPDLGLRRCACHRRRSYHHSGKSGEGWLGVDGQGLEGQEHDPDFVLLRSREFMHSEHRRGFIVNQDMQTSLCIYTNRCWLLRRSPANTHQQSRRWTATLFPTIDNNWSTNRGHFQRHFCRRG
jgi:hypothetical protein